MNKRARRTRRILRDHQRKNNLYLHVRRDFTLPALDVYSFWLCPRCTALTGGRTAPAELGVTTSLRESISPSRAWTAQITYLIPGHGPDFVEFRVHADTEDEAKAAAKDKYEEPNADGHHYTCSLDDIDVEPVTT